MPELCLINYFFQILFAGVKRTQKDVLRKVIVAKARFLVAVIRNIVTNLSFETLVSFFSFCFSQDSYFAKICKKLTNDTH